MVTLKALEFIPKTSGRMQTVVK